MTGTKASKPAKRTVQYKEPGHTVVTYKTRTLHIRFKQTPKQFAQAAKLRRKHAAKKSVATRRKNEENVYFKDGEYYSASGRNVTHKVRKQYESYENEMIGDDLRRDRVLPEDMRALLKDEHWEEVCGHTRWKYDNKSLEREFKKYLQSHPYY